MHLISMLGQSTCFANEETENTEDWPSIVWHIEPDLPFREQERHYNVKKIMTVSLIIIGLSLPNNKKCLLLKTLVGCKTLFISSLWSHPLSKHHKNYKEMDIDLFIQEIVTKYLL